MTIGPDSIKSNSENSLQLRDGGSGSAAAWESEAGVEYDEDYYESYYSVASLAEADADSGVWVHGDHHPFTPESDPRYNSTGNFSSDEYVMDKTTADVLNGMKATTLSLIILLAIFSNALVVISVFRYHKLRHINNYFLVSLAFADLLVACFAMTFNATVEITGSWKFGYRICDLWNSLDVHFSTVSTLHLCCISVDRYYAIVRPLKYTSYMTVRVASIMIGIAWTAPTLISFLPIFLGWYTTAEHQEWRLTHPNECIFKVNKPYALLSSTLTFWAPVIVMLIMYHRIYKEAVRQKEAIRRSSVPSQQHMIVDSEQIRNQFQMLQANGFKPTSSSCSGSQGGRNGSGTSSTTTNTKIIGGPGGGQGLPMLTLPLPSPTPSAAVPATAAAAAGGKAGKYGVPSSEEQEQELIKAATADPSTSNKGNDGGGVSSSIRDNGNNGETTVPLKGGEECETTFGGGGGVVSSAVTQQQPPPPPSLTPPTLQLNSGNGKRRVSMANSTTSEGKKQKLND